MPRYRISGAARADLRDVLATSLERWGQPAMVRYRSLLTAAIEAVASDPLGAPSRARADLRDGIRTLHVRHARGRHGVKSPVHILYYRIDVTGAPEILRVLHERMDPARHLEDEPDDA